jgi:hypothetical protein
VTITKDPRITATKVEKNGQRKAMYGKKRHFGNVRKREKENGKKKKWSVKGKENQLELL